MILQENIDEFCVEKIFLSNKTFQFEHQLHLLKIESKYPGFEYKSLTADFVF